VAGWSVVAAFVALSVALAVVPALGASVAGAEGASPDLVGVTVGILLVSLAMGAVFVQKRVLVRAVTAFPHRCRRLTGWPRGELAAHIDQIIRRLTAVHLSPGQVAGVLTLGLALWMLDGSCLALSFLAVEHRCRGRACCSPTGRPARRQPADHTRWPGRRGGAAVVSVPHREGGMASATVNMFRQVAPGLAAPVARAVGNGSSASGLPPGLKHLIPASAGEAFTGALHVAVLIPGIAGGLAALAAVAFIRSRPAHG
jgi:hypothetical protein